MYISENLTFCEGCNHYATHSDGTVGVLSTVPGTIFMVPSSLASHVEFLSIIFSTIRYIIYLYLNLEIYFCKLYLAAFCQLCRTISLCKDKNSSNAEFEINFFTFTSGIDGISDKTYHLYNIELFLLVDLI